MRGCTSGAYSSSALLFTLSLATGARLAKAQPEIVYTPMVRGNPPTGGSAATVLPQVQNPPSTSNRSWPSSPQPVVSPEPTPPQSNPWQSPTSSVQPQRPGCPSCTTGSICQNGVCIAQPIDCSRRGPLSRGFVSANRNGVFPENPASDLDEEKLNALRLERRKHPKVSIDVEGTLGSTGGDDRRANLLLVSALLGIRHHLSPRFGLHWRAGGLWGSAHYQDSSNFSPANVARADSTTGTGAVFQAIPFFGPFARFYVGPLLWGGYLSYEKLKLQSDQYSVTLKDGWAAGAGIHGGWVLGQREVVAVHFSIVGIASGGLTVLFTTGVGIQGRLSPPPAGDERR